VVTWPSDGISACRAQARLLSNMWRSGPVLYTAELVCNATDPAVSPHICLQAATNLAHVRPFLQPGPEPVQLQPELVQRHWRLPTRPCLRQLQRLKSPSTGPRTPSTSLHRLSPWRLRWWTRHCGRRRVARRTSIAAAQLVMQRQTL
jgi:hypothetical protein